MQKALESKRWKRGSDTLRSATDAFFKPATDVVQHVGQKAEPTLNKVSKNVGGRIIKTGMVSYRASVIDSTLLEGEGTAIV